MEQRNSPAPNRNQLSESSILHPFSSYQKIRCKSSSFAPK
ncbi:uncharacterized protein J3R85_000668 [Psidium guajava]|nr:uncharacterized protein J3R85_000668 [Psidium guajava]